MSFVHLHTHSEYSLLEASCRVKGLAKKAAEYGMPAVALTDNGNMFGAIEFYFACKDVNVKPILGMDVYLAPGSRHEKKQDRDQVNSGPKRLVLLAMNINGYRNLCKLSSIGFQEGFYWKPRIDYEVLQEHSQDLICLTGGIRGEVADTFLKEGAEAATLKIKKLKEIFSDRLYLEVNRTGNSNWEKIIEFYKKASVELNVPLVAANDVHYLNQEDQMIQEVLVCIGTNKTLSDESRFKLGSPEFYFKKTEEMKALFSDMPEAVENTQKIANLCDVKFKLKDESGKPIYHLPSFPTQGGVSLAEEIRRLSFEGLEVRFSELSKLGHPVKEEDKINYKNRLDYELSIIDRMGFNGYFLIVQDFINWAKKTGIPVGPGRGSGAGSLVAYCLRITDLDPLPNFLLFERFLNPERISMPDFDIDFCQDKRQEVIQYVTEKYGHGSVSQIITYGKLQARAAIKDVGRVLGMTFAEVDVVTKLFPDKLGITIKEAIELEPRLREMMEMSPQVATLIDLAQRLEGLVRHAGIHAAGVIIADGQLVAHAPLYKGENGENVVQYDMKHAEKIGLIKFDFLGLKTLTHVKHAIEMIRKNQGIEIRSEEIPMDDPAVFEMLSKGDTAGVFQFEGDGITDATRKIKPSSFADITAITSLYRPGPMANIPEFTDRKHGKSKVEYLIDDTKEILSETYGIMVYQEQVMGIASRIAGYSLGEADMLRRAMGKKIKEEMDRHRERFLQGAKEKGYDEAKSSELFELMYKFADYGFNKSHAAAYSVVTLQTAWVKCHYPVEFFAALLSTEINNTDNIVKYVKDALKHDIQVLPPSVNYSEYYFTCKDRNIYFGLGAIKGVGESAVLSILEARDKLPDKIFKTLDDFFNSVDLRKVNKKVIESLIKAGAFDGFGFHRAQILSGYSKYLDRALGLIKDRELGQTSLFDLGPETEKEVILENCKPWSRTFSLANEKEVLGFYLSDHPLNGFEKLIEVWTTCKVSDLVKHHLKIEEAEIQASKNGKPVEKKDQYRNGQKVMNPKKRVIVAGLITSMREIITKKGTRMAFAQVEDLSGACEIIVFPDTYAKFELLLKDEKASLVAGTLEVEEGNPKILVDMVAPLEDVLKKTKMVVFKLDKLDASDFEKLNSILKEYPGTTGLGFEVNFPDLSKKVIMESEEIKGVHMSNELFENIHALIGKSDFIEVRI